MRFLHGRWVRFQVTDLNTGWNFSYSALGPIVADSLLQPDVTIRGDMSAFVALAQQEEAQEDDDPSRDDGGPEVRRPHLRPRARRTPPRRPGRT